MRAECNTRQGSVIAYVLVLISIVSIVLVSVLQFITSQLRYSQGNHYREEALQIAEAGIQFYRWYLAHEVEGKTAQQVMDFWENQNPYGTGETPYVAEYKDPSGSALGRYSITVTPPDPGSTIVIVTSTGWTYQNPALTRTIRVRFRRPSWSEYIVLSNSMNRFGSGTEVWGKIFTNGGVHLDGVAHNIVQSSVEEYYDNDSDVGATKPGVWTAWDDEYNSDMNNDVFLAGKRYQNVPVKDFSTVSADMNLMKTEALGGNGRYFNNANQGRHIILKTNGTYDACTVNSFNNSTNNIINYRRNSGGGTCTTCSGLCLSNYPIIDGGVIFVENNVWLEGQVDNNRITVAAANLQSGSTKSVYLGRDLRYTNYDGSDVIGVVAQQDIEIYRNSNDVLRIDAALLAQEGRVGRKFYTSGCGCSSHSCEDHKNTITIHGSLVTNQRYGFAWSDGCPRNTGYTTRNLEFDNNLLYYPPPFFPTGTEYLVDNWEEL